MSQNNFLKVNDHPLSQDDAFAMSRLLDGYELRSALKIHFAIQEFAKARSVTLKTEHVQKALDNLRYELGLERAVNFEQWCTQNRVSTNALTLVSGINALRDLLKESFTTDELQQSFEETLQDEAIYYLYYLPLETREIAERVAEEIREKCLSFHDAVQSYGDEEIILTGGFFGETPRIELPPEYAKSVLNAPIDTLIGPLEDEGEEWTLLWVKGIIEPEFEQYEEQLRESLLERELEYFAERIVILDGT